MPRKNNEKTQLFLKFNTNTPTSFPLIDFAKNWEIRLYLLNRNNKEYILERGGANKTLLNKKISIVGCGSVGSEITLMLAKAGVGKLTLVDSDIFDSDNIYRHRLGGECLDFTLLNDEQPIKSKHKTTLLKEFIEKSLPYITVEDFPKTFMQVINEDEILNSDIIIIAVGSPTLCLEFNKKLKEKRINNVIYCWNEAGSVGGHSVIFDLNYSCFECLYSNDSGFIMQSELDFLVQGQNISKNLTGCGGDFTSFSYYDSVQTASLAVKQSIDFLLYNKTGYAFSWKGDNHENLRITERYSKSLLKEKINIIQKSGCRICNGQI